MRVFDEAWVRGVAPGACGFCVLFVLLAFIYPDFDDGTSEPHVNPMAQVNPK